MLKQTPKRRPAPKGADKQNRSLTGAADGRRVKAMLSDALLSGDAKRIGLLIRNGACISRLTDLGPGVYTVAALAMSSDYEDWLHLVQPRALLNIGKEALRIGNIPLARAARDAVQRRYASDERVMALTQRNRADVLAGATVPASDGARA